MVELKSDMTLRGQKYVQVGSEWVLKKTSFRLIKQLGQGGMATVWLALVLGTRTEDPDAQVAIKVLGTGNGPGSGGTKTRLEINVRFSRERDLLARLPHHPNVVQFIAFGDTDDGDLFFAMRYHDGMSLDAYIWQMLESQGLLVSGDAHADSVTSVSAMLRQCGTEEAGKYPKHAALFPYPAILAIGEALLSALQHCFEHGVTHRDLKPQNVVLSFDGITASNVTVLDFGIAKIACDADGAPLTQITRDHAVLGTPSYMSPEQMRGEKDIDVRTDIFAIGLMLLELITGARRGASAMNLSGQLSLCCLDNGAHDPGSYVADVPMSLRVLVRRATAKDPKDRYQTPKEMLAALREAARIIAVESRSEPPSQLKRVSVSGDAPTVRADAVSQMNRVLTWAIIGMAFLIAIFATIAIARAFRPAGDEQSHRASSVELNRPSGAVHAQAPSPAAPDRNTASSEASARAAQETAERTMRLGEIYLKQGRLSDACEKFRQAQELAPDLSGLSAKLARCGSR